LNYYGSNVVTLRLDLSPPPYVLRERRREVVSVRISALSDFGIVCVRIS